MNAQAKPLSEITRHAIALLSQEMGIVDSNRSRPGQGAAYRQKRGKPSEVGTPEQGP
jgi:hypothetical protein